MPEDRESMLWLNIKGIPATDDVSDKNIVQFAINSRIKLIYRPAALKMLFRKNLLKNCNGQMMAEPLR